MKTRLLLLITMSAAIWTYSGFVRAATISKPMLNTGLVGYWSFDVGKGGRTAYDMSPSKNNGTLTNMDLATDWVAGKVLQALDFDGSNDFVLANPDFNPGTGDFAFVFWVRTTQTGDNHLLVNDWSGTGSVDAISVFIGTSSFGCNNGSAPAANKVTFIMRDGTIGYCAKSTTSVNDGNWHFIVAQRVGGSLMELYVDSAREGTYSSVSGLTFNPDGTQFNVAAGGTGGFWPTAGTFDDVRIYNRALSAGEIKRLYNMTGPIVKAPTNLGLVGYWSFNEGTSTVATDFSGNGNRGVLTGGPTWANGRLGKALSFDGVNDNVNMGTVQGPTGQMTASAWVKPSSLSDFRGIFMNADVAGADSNFVWYLAGNKPRVYWGGSTIGTANTSLSLNTWQHVVFVRSGSSGSWTLTFYLNGATNGSAATTVNPGTSTSAQKIGVSLFAPEFWNGLIDDVRIYNRALSAAEIQTLYSSSKYVATNSSQNAKLTSGLVGLWSFDGGDMGTTSARDASGNNNTGWLVNGVTKTLGKIGQALSFDGSDDYVDAGNSGVLKLTGAMTAAAWIKLNSNYTSTQDIIGNANVTGGFYNYILEFGRTDNKFGFFHNAQTNPVNATAISDNNWHHIVAVRTGSAGSWTITFYLDGYPDGTGSLTDNPQTSTFPTVIGALGSTGGFFRLNGLIDDVRIYNRALSADEITRLYNLGR